MLSRLGSFLEQVTDYLLVRAGCFSLPVDLERVAVHLGVDRIVKEPIAAEGYVEETSPGRYKVGLRIDRGFERQRFSLAHELGHVIFHKLRGESDTPLARQYRSCTAVSTEANEEAFADEVAGLMLLPNWALGYRLSRGFSLRRVVGLAQSARTSVATALIRSLRYTTSPSVGFHLRMFRGRPDSLRCLWSQCSPSVPRVLKENVIELLGADCIRAELRRNAGDGHGLLAVSNKAIATVELYRRSYFEKLTVFGIAHLSNLGQADLFDEEQTLEPNQDWISDSVAEQQWKNSGLMG
jgi:hypothetical protein